MAMSDCSLDLVGPVGLVVPRAPGQRGTAGMGIDHDSDLMRQACAAPGIDGGRNHDMAREVAFPVSTVLNLEHLAEIEMRQHAVTLLACMRAQLLMGALAHCFPQCAEV